MNKIRMKQAGAIALSCVVFISAKAAETRQLTLTALGETRITVPQGETRAVQYWLSNNSEQIRTLTMKPIKGLEQQFNGDDGDYCAKLTTLKPGQSCLLKLNVNTNEITNFKNISPLVCENGANWFDNQVVASESCTQPLVAEKLSVNVIPKNTASFSIKIDKLNDSASGIKNKASKNFCYNSAIGCSLTLFAGGGTNSITLTSTSTTKTATNIHAVLPWTDVTSTSCPVLSPGATCRIIFNSSASAKHGQAPIQIVGDNTGPAVTINVEVLGVGDNYQDGLIYVVNPGMNSGMLAFATDSEIINSFGYPVPLPWSTGPNSNPSFPIGTSLEQGFINTILINHDFPFPTSAASICKNGPDSLTNPPAPGHWYLPSYDEMNTFVRALVAAYGDPIQTNPFSLFISSGDYYWTSSEGSPAGDPSSSPTNFAYQTSFTTNAGAPSSRASSKISPDNGLIRCIRRFS